MNNNYLAHHGRLGQKWGKKNGPPYPLDYNKLSAEERKLAKDDAIRRGDIKEANFNRRYFTDDEVRAVINRFNLDMQLSAIDKSMTKSNLDKAKEFADKATTVADITNKGMNVWNTFAKVSNGITGTDLPVIDMQTGQNVTKKLKKEAAKAAQEEVVNAKKREADYAKAQYDLENSKLNKAKLDALIKNNGSLNEEGYMNSKNEFIATKKTITDMYGNVRTVEIPDLRKTIETTSMDPTDENAKKFVSKESWKDADGNSYTYDAYKKGKDGKKKEEDKNK